MPYRMFASEQPGIVRVGCFAHVRRKFHEAVGRQRKRLQVLDKRPLRRCTGFPVARQDEAGNSGDVFSPGQGSGQLQNGLLAFADHDAVEVPAPQALGGQVAGVYPSGRGL